MDDEEDNTSIYDEYQPGTTEAYDDEEFNISDDDSVVSNQDEYNIDLIINNEDDEYFYTKYNSNKNKSSKNLTKFERTQVLSERITHLSNGCKPYVNINNNISLYDIALKELNENKLPYIIKRNIGQSVEYWKLSDLII